MIIFKRLVVFLKPYWKHMLGAFAITLLLNGSTLLQPVLLKLLTDKVLVGKSFFYLNLIVGGFLLLVIFKGATAYFQGYIMTYAIQRAVNSLRLDFFRHLQALPLKFYEKMRLGEIQSRATNDIQVASLLYSSLVGFINDTIILAGSLGWMFYKDWKMTLLNLVVSPLLAMAVHNFGKLIRDITEKLQTKIADLYSVLYEAIASVKVVKSFNREEHVISRFRDKNEEYFGSQMKLAQFTLTQTPVVEFLAALGIVVVVWYGALQIILGRFTMGEMMAYWGFMVLATQPLNRIASTYTNFQQAIAAGKRIFDVMDLPPEAPESEDSIDLPELAGEVEFDHVSFAYDDENYVLSDICLKVRPGEVVALVGPNGAGKSTLVNMISRFYENQKGVVSVDGYDISKVKIRSLRRQISLVPQETVIFLGTIRENIAYGRPGASEEEVLAASKAANAHEFIMQLPNGYDTSVVERGVNLSGGQRQRLAIARALLMNPRILILDEFTSGIDSESENLIQEAIEHLIKGRTCFVIAHRLSTIRNADRIIVLDQGRIEEEGTHQELLEKGGLFSRLYESHFCQEPEAKNQ
ncbi:MAG: ABC transporter ATP-binding protein [bacterium]